MEHVIDPYGPSYFGQRPVLGEGQPRLESVVIRRGDGNQDRGLAKHVWLSNPATLQKYLDRCSPTLTALQINRANIESMEGVHFPANLITMNLQINRIPNLNGVQFPPNLTHLYLNYNGINSLQGANFPSTLTTLHLDHNDIQNLDRIQFPPRLTTLLLNDNRLIHMNGVQFPPGLTILDLSNSEERGDERGGYGYNQLKSFNEVKFPPSLTELNLQRNRLETLGRIIEPTPNILQLIENQFPKIVEEYRKTLTRQSQQEQTALTRQYQQTEQTTLKEISDFNQQSMQNQLRGITSFLREGMEAHAQQHAKQLRKEREDKGRAMIEVRIILNGIQYPVPVPLNTADSVQSVLDYMNEHYYISSLVPNCGAMHLYKSDGKSRLKPKNTLAHYGVQKDNTLNAQSHMMQLNPHGGGNQMKRIQTRKNKIIKRPKKWSLKYKKSINCKRPRGFSQRQYCKYGRK
jgi:hypothetical protein